MTFSEHQREIAEGRRFEFGKNWSQFLHVLNDDRIAEARHSLGKMLNVTTLSEKSFIDIGSGSGLMSLAAMQMDAKNIYSFDYDNKSVECTKELRRRYYPGATNWVVNQGSVLDKRYISSLGTFDVVYSWGVLHHTGKMWEALANSAALVAKEGRLFIAIYNDQGGWSRRWTKIKRVYNQLPRALQPMFALAIMGPRELRMAAISTLRLEPLSYLKSWTNYHKESKRGMSRWHDIIDWVGGYPFEVAAPEDIFRFFRDRGFVLQELATQRAGLGCNEFVFQRK